MPTALRRLLPALAAVLALAGCETLRVYLPDFDRLGVYKLDINQGNYLSQDMVDKLKVGQGKQQVRALLGTPLLNDPFHENRWDYVYEFRRNGRLVEHRQFTVFFLDDKLARWEGGEMPMSAIEMNRVAADRSIGHIYSADDKGFIQKLIDLLKGNW